MVSRLLTASVTALVEKYFIAEDTHAKVGE